MLSSPPCPAVVRWLFLLFVFTFPFEQMTVVADFSITKLAGFVFFVCYFFCYGSPLARRPFPPMPRAMRWFLVFIAIDGANGLLLGPPEYLMSVLATLFQLTQLAIMLWIGSDLLKDDKMARSVLLAYSIAASLFAAGIVFKVPGFYDELGEGREAAMGQNPNAVAANSAIAIVIIIGFLLSVLRRRLPLMLLSLPLFGAIVVSGSRGGVLAFVIGSMVYLLPYRRAQRTLAAGFLAIVAITTVVYLVAKNSDFAERWEQTYYESSLGGGKRSSLP